MLIKHENFFRLFSHVFLLVFVESEFELRVGKYTLTRKSFSPHYTSGREASACYDVCGNSNNPRFNFQETSRVITYVT